MKKLFNIIFISLLAGSSLMAMDAQIGQQTMRNARDAARQNIDLYAIIGVAEDASQALLNSTGRRKARQLHPDGKAGGNQDEFQRFNNAYTILKDSDTRAMYDRSRAAVRNLRSGWKQRRQKFVDTLRAYRGSVAAAATAVVAGAVVMTSQVVNCGDVARAICNGQAVAPVALQTCANYLPSSFSCFTGMF